MKKFLVITSIDKPSALLKQISKKSLEHSVSLIVVGDRKSPNNFKLKNTIFLSLKNQKKQNISYASLCPENSYARKNIGYLYAMKKDANIIYETDDDNELLDSFYSLKPIKKNVYTIRNGGWVNIYSYFSNKQIWPRGFPLSEIQKNKIESSKLNKKIEHSPINQRLCDENPDVDAVFRLIKKIPFNFKKSKDTALSKNSWCPFNSQNTVWHKEAYPLMYLPAYASFRMADIWRSLIAQRICWENNWSILHSNSTVIHKRNDHNIMKDFNDEIPGYLNNDAIAKNLSKLKLRKGTGNLAYNLVKCYKLFCKENLLNYKELKLLDCWLKDIKMITQ